MTQNGNGGVRPSITEAMRAVDQSDHSNRITEEILAVTEDFAEYVARRSRGITVATPERRYLRQAIEKIVLSFIQNAEDPKSEEVRPAARVQAISDQSDALSSSDDSA